MITNTLEALRPMNVERCETSFHPLNEWSPAEYGNALAGEVGEACNLLKKLRRGDSVEVNDIAKELADVVVYADLLSARLGIDLCKAIQEKFNEVSDRKGSSIKFLL